VKYVFANGTAQQKRLWEEGSGLLLNLPAADLNITSHVTFEPPSQVVGRDHTDLALTTWSYGSSSSTCIVRSDAPSFGTQQAALEAEAAKYGLPYSVARFFIESGVHELGHSLYADLPEENRIAIAKLFGANGDEGSELAPAGSAWPDRIIEGIAETFKEAFLPRRYRVFPNRTNRKLSYSLYPRFRELFRVTRGRTNRQFIVPVVGGTQDAWRPPSLAPKLGWVDFDQGTGESWRSFVPPEGLSNATVDTGDSVSYTLPYPTGGFSKLVIKDIFFLEIGVFGLFFHLTVTLTPGHHEAKLELVGDKFLEGAMEVTCTFGPESFTVKAQRSNNPFFSGGEFSYQTEWLGEGPSIEEVVLAVLGADRFSSIGVPPSSVTPAGARGASHPSPHPITGNRN
jgi:hypothetical protein